MSLLLLPQRKKEMNLRINQKPEKQISQYKGFPNKDLLHLHLLFLLALRAFLSTANAMSNKEMTDCHPKLLWSVLGIARSEGRDNQPSYLPRFDMGKG